MVTKNLLLEWPTNCYAQIIKHSQLSNVFEIASQPANETNSCIAYVHKQCCKLPPGISIIQLSTCIMRSGRFLSLHVGI